MKMIKGKAKWAHVQKPNTKFEYDRWEITIEVDFDTYERYTSEVNFGHKETDNGTYEIRLEMPTHQASGAPNKPPLVVDKKAKPMTDLIGNGSEVLVKYRTFFYEKGRQKGKTRAYLLGVQVVDLVEYTEDDGEEVSFDAIA